MKLRVMLLSPCGGLAKDREQHRRYLRRVLRDSIKNHNEAPFASHELYTRALNDDEPEERILGMELGLAWLGQAQRVVVYADRGISAGMSREIDAAVQAKIPVLYRYVQRRKASVS